MLYPIIQSWFDLVSTEADMFCISHLCFLYGSSTLQPLRLILKAQVKSQGFHEKGQATYSENPKVIVLVYNKEITPIMNGQLPNFSLPQTTNKKQLSSSPSVLCPFDSRWSAKYSWNPGKGDSVRSMATFYFYSFHGLCPHHTGCSPSLSLLVLLQYLQL